jgi:plastocyanin
MPKNRYQLPRRTATWFYTLVIAIGLMVVLAACGGGDTTSAAPAPASTPATVASTPSVPPTSTSTAVPTPVPGLTQIVLITNSSDGSFGFTPSQLAIRAGATVIWKNMSSAPHTVTSDDGQTFDSGNVLPGGSFKFTFKTAGTFHYHCNIHPYMRAVIVVV